MKRQPTNREYVLGGLFALMAMFPMVTSVELGSGLQGRVTQDTIERAFKDRKNESTMRRMRWSVMRDCAQREALGETNVCPDINDEGAMQRYWLLTDHDAAEEEEESPTKASMDDLGAHEKSILRRARRNGQCPPELDGILAGFQGLCDSVVAEGTDRIDAIKEAADRWVGAPRVPKSPSEHYLRLKQQE